MGSTQIPLLLTLSVVFLGCSFASGRVVVKSGSHLPNIIHLDVRILHGPEDRSVKYSQGAEDRIVKVHDAEDAGVEYQIPEPSEPKEPPAPVNIGREAGEGEPPAPVKIGEENEEGPPEPIKPGCIMMNSYDAELYEYYGCELSELFEGCYTKPVCPEACTADDGTLREENGPMWMEKDEKSMCECVTSDKVLGSPPVPPEGAGPWPPYKHCRANGCTIQGTDTLLPGGATVQLYGAPCVCLEGSDPNLMDYASLYHLKCFEEEREDEGAFDEEFEK
ncbi:uncharacterized protein LOC135495360 [Lineus longissimus]|uniref:uncharacterized protein LOC135495360 n=1 Tax=Lineus longissimus TaxID=88925 RepID=UPI002B4EE2C1